MQKHEPIKLAYKVVEPSGGADESLAPIIFLHGFAESKELWHDLPQIISDRTKRRSYLYDARNHGDSKWTSTFNFIVNIADLEYFTNSMNINKMIFIGQSMGGYTGSMYALKWPAKVEAVIVTEMSLGRNLNKVGRGVWGLLEMWQKGVQSIPKEFDETEGIKFTVDYVYSRIPPKMLKKMTPKEILYKCKFPIRRTEDGSYDVKTNMKAIREAARDTDRFSLVAEGVYTGPTCYIYGDLSSIALTLNEEEGQIQRHFPNYEMVCFEGATHNVPTEFPEKFVDTILKFLDKNLKQNVSKDESSNEL